MTSSALRWDGAASTASWLPRSPRFEKTVRSVAYRGAGPAIIVSSAVAAQFGDGLVVPLFRQAGPLGMGAVRFLAASAVLMIATRPSLRGRSRTEWTAVISLGLVAAAMNLTYYEAAARLPLGMTSTIEFLGPFAIAATAAIAGRKLIELLFSILAVAGVATLSLASLRVSAVGLVLAALSAVALAGYVLLAGRLARRSTGTESLSLSVLVSAIVSLPFLLLAAPHLSSVAWGRGAISGCLGIAVVYALELRALKLTSAKTVSVLLSLEPAVAGVVGFLVLGQRLTTPMLVGMICVLAAAVGVTATAQQPAS